MAVCDPLAQLAEHLTFNQGVWSSNLQWVTIPLSPCGRGGMADAPDLGSGANWRMGSSPFARTNYISSGACGSSSVVECHLAKVDVASSNLVYRSICGCSSMAELQPSKLATWVRFPSPAPAKTLSNGQGFLIPQKHEKIFRIFSKKGVAILNRRCYNAQAVERT